MEGGLWYHGSHTNQPSLIVPELSSIVTKQLTGAGLTISVCFLNWRAIPPPKPWTEPEKGFIQAFIEMLRVVGTNCPVVSVELFLSAGHL